MAIVYRHRRMSDNKVFYIGISNKNGRRSNSIHRRNPLWNNIKNKHGFYSEILIENISQEEAFELEMFLISLYGRIDNNTGILCNMTDGGEGSFGIKRIHSEETKLKMSKSAQGRIMKESSKKLLEDHFSKEVIDTSTNITYKSAKIAALKNNIKYSTLKCWLSGIRKNKSTFKYKN